MHITWTELKFFVESLLPVIHNCSSGSHVLASQCVWSNSGCYLVLGVTQNSLHGSLRGLLAGCLDIGVRRRLGQTACQVHHRHISHGHPEGHAGQLPGERTDIKEISDMFFLLHVVEGIICSGPVIIAKVSRQCEQDPDLKKIICSIAHERLNGSYSNVTLCNWLRFPQHNCPRLFTVSFTLNCL